MQYKDLHFVITKLKAVPDSQQVSGKPVNEYADAIGKFCREQNATIRRLEAELKVAKRGLNNANYEIELLKNKLEGK